MAKKNYRYDLAGRFWNVDKWDIWYTRVDSQKKLIGILHTMIKELRPYQISITDHNQESPEDTEDPIPKYKQLGISFVPDERGKIMKCWECKKEINRATRVCYCDGYESKFRDVCEDCYNKLDFDATHHVRVERITRGQLKRGRR